MNSERNTTRVGLLGAGYIADYHARALRELGRPAIAICDLNLSRAREAADRWSIPHAFDSLDAMLAGQRLDAVHVLTPPNHHAAVTRTLLNAGVHVFLEKPLATTTEDADQLAALAVEKRVRLGVGHNFLFYRPFEQLRNDLRAGRLGRIDHVTINWRCPLPQLRHGPFDAWMLRDPGNIMLEVGPHPVAAMVDLIGEPLELDVLVSRPFDLPDGGIFFQRWQVRAHRNDVAVDLNFSFSPDFAEHSVLVRGSFGAAAADLANNLYTLSRHTACGPDVDQYLRARRAARTMLRQATGNLGRYMLSKFGLARDGNAYQASITAAMRSFYDHTNDSRINTRFSASVVRQCVRIAEAADIQARPTLPPRAVAPARKPTVLVLGGTGFIGRHLVRKLVSEGRAVRLLSRRPVTTDLPVEVMIGDVRNAEDVARALEGIDVVFHLARAMVNTWKDYLEQDVNVTRRIAEQCLARNVRRFIYTSTTAAYFAGDPDAIITEATPLDPKIDRRNAYSRSKAVSESILMRMHRERGLPVVIVRPGIVIGADGGFEHWGVGMWPSSGVCRVWGDGENKLPVVLVDDVVAALAATINADNIDGEAFNLVADPCVTARDYLQAVERTAGVELQKLYTPIWRFYALDVCKWIVKCLVRHPNRARPSYRDWLSRRELSRHDCTKAKRMLRWQPTSDVARILERGVCEPVRTSLP